MGEARFQHVRKTPDIGEMHNLYSRDYDNQDKLQNVDEILATHFAPPSASAGIARVKGQKVCPESRIFTD